MATPFLLGTYTDDTLAHVTGKADGILQNSADRGDLDTTTTAVTVTNPSWVTLDRDRTHVYAVIETKTFEGADGGGVAAYLRDTTTGALTLLNTRPSGGVEPAHVEVDPSGRFVLVANYRNGSVAVFSLRDNGSLGEMVSLQQHEGSSIHPVRQSGPHAHQIVFDPRADRVLVPDLGRDEVLVYDFANDGQLMLRPESAFRTSPGAGPRHLVWHPDAEHLFLLNELDSTLTVYARSGQHFDRGATASTLPQSFDGHNQTAAVRVHPAGQHVFVSNRGHDSIGVFEVDQSTWQLRLVHTEPTRGREPRDFVVIDDGATLLVANQDTDSIESFDFTPADGALHHRSSAEAQTPVCIAVL